MISKILFGIIVLGLYFGIAQSSMANPYLDQEEPATELQDNASSVRAPQDSKPFGDESTGARGPANEGADTTEKWVQEVAGPLRGEEAYTIGVRDLVEIKVFQVPELDHVGRVDADGTISMPLLGEVKIAGLSEEDAERAIEKALGKDYLRDPHVTVFIQEYNSRKIMVDGAVKSPGIFTLKNNITLHEAIVMAGGKNRFADTSELVIFRAGPDGKVLGYVVNFDDIVEGNIKDPQIQSKDVIIMGTNGSKEFLYETAATFSAALTFAPLL